MTPFHKSSLVAQSSVGKAVGILVGLAVRQSSHEKGQYGLKSALSQMLGKTHHGNSSLHGIRVSTFVGLAVGGVVGFMVRDAVGFLVGDAVGFSVGAAVGLLVAFRSAPKSEKVSSHEYVTQPLCFFRRTNKPFPSTLPTELAW